MVFLIGGESHTGKTLLAQKLLECYHYPYVSLDHIKMGFIRASKNKSPQNTMLMGNLFHNIPFSVEEDSKIASFLSPFVQGIIQTALENKQNLIIEGVYLQPKVVSSWLHSLQESNHIKALFLLFSQAYIHAHFECIVKYENNIEKRKDSIHIESKEEICKAHEALKQECLYHHLPFVEIQNNYEREIIQAIEYFKSQ